MGRIAEMMEWHRVTLCNLHTLTCTPASVTSDFLYERSTWYVEQVEFTYSYFPVHVALRSEKHKDSFFRIQWGQLVAGWVESQFSRPRAAPLHCPTKNFGGGGLRMKYRYRLWPVNCSEMPARASVQYYTGWGGQKVDERYPMALPWGNGPAPEIWIGMRCANKGTVSPILPSLHIPSTNPVGQLVPYGGAAFHGNRLSRASPLTVHRPSRMGRTSLPCSWEHCDPIGKRSIALRR